MDQREQIQSMSDREVLLHLYVTQLLLLVASALIGAFLLDWTTVRQMWRFDFREVVLYGGGGALFVLALDFLMMRYLPESWYDDGGINEKLFQTRSFPHLIWLCAFIAFSEEWLFRGVLQTHFGLFVASAIFALLHVRYLTKWFLFSMVVLISFFLGYLYDVTGSLWVTIFAHFLIDFVLAVHIRLDYLRKASGKMR
ncbi:CPBP family intramembrane glutamic endopeptidase [Anoxybacillus sp. J5B_2022]|uniref:CPBP family intramembrane glutamic endopeptidase n=1 Tax=Anoxybacillus sp. J5B_2022 TaxID=3003246 RepID=UPI0022869981|nr:CPBP family intramembrane glutamic endopeptidase [Anoxybacillus sp. J5B_2022]MCZ0754531.1 CPBP family intramembrane metalloprotease [Anoxybacillus sp. J5B_2022]